MTIARAFLVALLVLGASVADTLAARPEVRDEAGFFSADAVRQATRVMQEIRQKYGKDVLIETYPEPPADLKARLAREPREKVFADWVQRRAGEAGVNGIYVLISRNPAYLQVGVGSDTRKAAFTPADRDHLRDLLLEAFRQKRYDEGLLNAVDFTQRTLELNVGSGGSGGSGATAPSTGGGRTTAAPAPAPAPGRGPERERAPEGLGGVSWAAILFWGALLLVGLWGLSRYFRNRAADAASRQYGARPGEPGYGAGPGTPGYGPGYGAPPAYGGGLGRGMLGGLLGGMAGGYLYDRLRGRGAEAGPFDRPGEPGVDQGDFGSSGGGFDEGAPSDAFESGGDFGGDQMGDSGGGDFGGDAGDSAA